MMGDEVEKQTMLASRLGPYIRKWDDMHLEELQALIGASQATVQPAAPAVTVGTYEVKKITNGYLVETTLPGKPRTLHYAEDYKAVGEFITANSVKNEIEGRDQR